jgi:hypothetical protein
MNLHIFQDENKQEGDNLASKSASSNSISLRVSNNEKSKEDVMQEKLDRMKERENIIINFLFFFECLNDKTTTYTMKQA